MWTRGMRQAFEPACDEVCTHPTHVKYLRSLESLEVDAVVCSTKPECSIVRSFLLYFWMKRVVQTSNHAGRLLRGSWTLCNIVQYLRNFEPGKPCKPSVICRSVLKEHDTGSPLALQKG